MMSSVSSTSSTVYSGMNGSGGGNILRITGMASGLDVDSIVKKMLSADQTKIDKAQQAQQLLQWKQSAYQSIIDDVKDLQNTYFNVTSPDSLLSDKNYSSFDVSSSVSTVANATAQNGASEGTYILNVLNLATAATITGDSLNSQAKIDASNIASNWEGSGKQITFNVTTTDSNNNTVVTPYTVDFSGFNKANPTASDLVTYINQQISNNPGLSGKVSASTITDSTGTYIRFNALTTSQVQISNALNATTVSEMSGLQGKNVTSVSDSSLLTNLDSTLNDNIHLSLMCNGTAYSVSLDNSNGSLKISDLEAAIYQQTKGNITASVDDVTGKFTLNSSNTGTSSVIGLLNNATYTSDANIMNALGLSSQQNMTAQGVDAQVQITSPGSANPITVTESSNKFTLNNMNYTLTNTGNTSLTVSFDSQNVVDRFSAFFKKYNSIIDEINEKLNEKKDADYQPLTDSQKSQMSATDITNWNTKAQQGILRDDPNLESLLTNLRNAFFDPVSGSGINFGKKQVGMDTSDDYTKAGEVNFVDGGEDTFKQTLESNGSDILKLFNSTSSVSYLSASNNPDQKKARYNSEGIMQRLSDILTDNVGYAEVTDTSSTLTKYTNLQDDYSTTGYGTGSTLPDQIYSQSILIKNLQTKMSTDSDKYYNQFSKLETALTELSSQQSALSSMLGTS